MTQKMTIHRALSELKLIDSKIEKSINEICPIGMYQEGKLIDNFLPLEDFNKLTNAKYQSVNDLIERKNKIKSAIVKANAETIVTIAGKKYTIAEAINFKKVIEIKKILLDKLVTYSDKIKSKVNFENDKIYKTALENAKIILGKQGDDKVKATDEDVKNIVDPFVKRNEYKIIDPLKIDTLIENLTNEIDSFEVDVDSVLSEINSLTFIEL